MNRFFQEPVVRLFLRALLVGGVAFANKFVDVSGHVTWSSAALHGALVAAGLGFAEVFTPLNPLVGLFKNLDAAGTVSAPADPIEPSGDTTEASAAA